MQEVLLLSPTPAVAPQHPGIPGTEPEEDPVQEVLLLSPTPAVASHQAGEDLQAPTWPIQLLKKGLSHEIDFKNVDKNLQNLA